MIGDEETGAIATTGTAAAIEAHPSTTRTKSWIVATHRSKVIVGAAAIAVLSIVALALSIGLSTSGSDDGDDDMSEAATSDYESTHPKIPDGDDNNTADYGDEPKGSSLSENNGMASEGEFAAEKIPCPCPVPRPQMAWPPWLDSTSEAASATLSPVEMLLPSSTPAPSTNNPSTGTTDEVRMNYNIVLLLLITA